MKRLLITGSKGFTGYHLAKAARASGWTTYGLESNLLEKSQLQEEVRRQSPFAGVIHLAGISSVTHQKHVDIYETNIIGTQYLLDALEICEEQPAKVILASSANVYGNSLVSNELTETDWPRPLNHYANSKLAMEFMALTYLDKLPIVITRPFNYTGPGHDRRFVIPKLVDAFVRRLGIIELGNLEVEREFNDVRMVCDVYTALLAKAENGEVYNIASGHGYSLMHAVQLLQRITGHCPEIRVNQKFVRPNEVHRLTGSPKKLKNAIGELKEFTLENTLRWMVDTYRQPEPGA